MTKEKIDINLITPGWDVRKLNQFDYMEVVYRAGLEKMGKYLLSYYAFRYNFKKGRGAYAGVKRTARDLGISTNTVNTWKKYLLQQQWIEVKKRGNKETDVIYVSIGYPDPTISVPDYLQDDWEDWNEFLKDNRNFPQSGNAADQLSSPSIENLESIDGQEPPIEGKRELSVAV
jgi:DNA-binding transcriptional MocR family regulator